MLSCAMPVKGDGRPDLVALSPGPRIVKADKTGTSINEAPVYRFTLQVAGPQGP